MRLGARFLFEQEALRADTAANLAPLETGMRVPTGNLTSTLRNSAYSVLNLIVV